MAWVPTFLRRLRGLIRPTRFEREMDAELRHHLDLEAERLVQRGVPPAEARVMARRAFGSVATVKDECRDSWGMRAIDAIGQDLRFGARNLLKYPAYTSIVLLTLGLGIGANTAIFSVVHAVLLNPLPYGNGARLVEVKQQQTHIGVDNGGMSPKELAAYRQQTASLDAIVEYHQMSFNLVGEGDASRVTTGVVSPDFFEVMGIRPMMGRTFRAADDVKDAPAVLVLSYPYWENALGADPNVIGRTFEMNDRVHTVVGVLPPVPQYNPGGGVQQDNDVYMPTSPCPFRQRPAVVDGQTVRMVNTIGLLKPGVALARAQNDLALVANRLQNEFAAKYPDAYGAAGGFTATATW